MAKSDIKLNIEINNYEELSAKAEKLINLIKEAKQLSDELKDSINGIDFLNLS
ncbi:hypothetical protein SDC9_41247 [bioreactor metagenome]|uniref:Uncharacterized protein n=1 Tax=bioreactor metagenome TaxID=1076179 RepID=A0A644VUH4_9ZZZZ